MLEMIFSWIRAFAGMTQGASQADFSLQEPSPLGESKSVNQGSESEPLSSNCSQIRLQLTPTPGASPPGKDSPAVRAPTHQHLFVIVDCRLRGNDALRRGVANLDACLCEGAERPWQSHAWRSPRRPAASSRSRPNQGRCHSPAVRAPTHQQLSVIRGFPPSRE